MPEDTLNDILERLKEMGEQQSRMSRKLDQIFDAVREIGEKALGPLEAFQDKNCRPPATGPYGAH